MANSVAMEIAVGLWPQQIKIFCFHSEWLMICCHSLKLSLRRIFTEPGTDFIQAINPAPGSKCMDIEFNQQVSFGLNEVDLFGEPCESSDLDHCLASPLETVC